MVPVHLTVWVPDEPGPRAHSGKPGKTGWLQRPRRWGIGPFGGGGGMPGAFKPSEETGLGAQIWVDPWSPPQPWIPPRRGGRRPFRGGGFW